MNDPARLWADPRLVYTVAATAVALLLVTIWLFGRRRRHGRQAGVVCLIISIALHLSLFFLVPMLPSAPGGSSSVDEKSNQDAGVDTVALSSFEPEMMPVETAGESQAMVAPLPVSNLTDLVEETAVPEEIEQPREMEAQEEPEQVVPEVIAESMQGSESELMPELASDLDSLLDAAFASSEESPAGDDGSSPELSDSANPIEEVSDTPLANSDSTTDTITKPNAVASPKMTPATTEATEGSVAGTLKSDFANRTGAAKEHALLRTGGNAQTEAAVAEALRFLVSMQRPDGSWDPRSSGAGVERSPLGTSRGGAGARAETAITGLALLSLIGAGNTHQSGDYADNVYRGLAYLIRSQQPNGSLAGKASPYAATYSHGMAALAIGEAAAITADPSAMMAARRAVDYTQRLQHTGTGGWRYVAGDPGDLSQLGWQAMVLDAGHRAGIQLSPRSVSGVQRFLQSVRMGSRGGLACYRRGEAPSRTMTAEALATRLLIGEQVPAEEVAEAERYLLQQPPGVGQDNYYYWYYATLALHQLQDDAWGQWNDALKRRLLATQQSDGSWGSNTVWGGYGGSVYTTSMAALCLETYYRHAIRTDNDRITRQRSPASQR